MLRIVACDSRRAATMPRRSPLSSVTPEDFDRDIRSRAHRNPDVGSRKRRGVVDPVAGHGDDPTFLPKAFDRLALVLRQNLRLDFSNAELAPNRFGGRAVVAGEHHDADAHCLERAKRIGRRRLDRIGDGDHAAGLAVERGEDHRRAIAAQFVRQRFEGA